MCMKNLEEHIIIQITLAVRTCLQSDLSWLNVPQAKQTIKQERALASCNSAR
ncbi:hypothetical protein NC651_025604 [Populus alba x Populus x berolinensis]|nr:hypothetical protein NC651_025604 [Populus alba x Populus x berolinensis]